MWVTDLKVRYKSVDKDERRHTTEIPILLDPLAPSILSFCKKTRRSERIFTLFYFENKVLKQITEPYQWQFVLNISIDISLFSIDNCLL